MLNEGRDFLERIIEKSKKCGADHVEAVLSKSHGVAVSVRGQKLEEMEESTNKDFGLRVVVDGAQAMVSSSDFSEKSIDLAIQRAIDVAKNMPKDPELIFAKKDMVFNEFIDLELFDKTTCNPAKLLEMSMEVEDAALQNKLITNIDSVSSSFGETEFHFASSENFYNHGKQSSFSCGASVIAGKNDEMQTAYEGDSRVFFADLKKPKFIGEIAAANAVARLNPVQIKTGKMPVILDPKVSKQIPGMLSAAINGARIALGMSFLKDKMGHKIFPENLNIIDDPLMKRGSGSRHFDGEGLRTSKKFLIENGVLANWLLDLKSAAKLGLKSNASASKGLTSLPTPSTSNLYIENGKISKQNLIAGVKKGFYVTEISSGVSNLLNGDFSKGAEGFLIENGKITKAVHNVTIASNIAEMFKNIVVADDLEFKFRTNAPTILIQEMTVAGS